MSDWANKEAHALMWKIFPGGFAFRSEAKDDVVTALRKARDDALEEAAKVIETECHDDMTRAEEAAAIRAMIPVRQ